MRILLMLFIIVLKSISVFGQPDSLLPCSSLRDPKIEIETKGPDTCWQWKNITNQVESFEIELNKLLLKDFAERPLARYKVRPFLSPEYCLQLEKNTDAYVLKVNYLKTKFLDLKIDTGNLIHKEKRINSDFAQNIISLFEKVLDSIAYTNIKYGLGLDGDDYYFYQYNENNGITCGSTWSPIEGTNMYELVQICDVIFNYVKNEENDIEKIKSQIERFIKHY